MLKKHFIALADAISFYNRQSYSQVPAYRKVSFTDDQLAVLADFCQSQNYNFNRERWLGYIHGDCGPCGGKPQAGGPGKRKT